MRIIIVVCCVFICVDFIGAINLTSNSTSLTQRAIYRRSVHRKEKFWGVGIVRFENGVCLGAENLQGTCYTRRQCAWIPGGVRSGSCASGIGVCCVVQATCGNSTHTNNTYFVSPNFPSTYAGGASCSITIKACPGVCQLRIDFLSLTLAQPDGNGSCIFDAMYVLGGASQVPIICGENSGQHIYVDFNGNADIQIVIDTSVAVPLLNRNWNLLITQIGCDCPTRAPAGCLMYYTALSGTVTSLNYGQTASSGISNPTTNATGTRELANMNYGVCVEMQPGYCSITWSQSGGDPYSFTVSGDTITATGMGTVGTPAAAMVGDVCTTDFVVIPNPSYVNGTAVGSDRFCGNAFNSVTTSSKPFVLTVVTDANDMNDAGNRGFSLMYMQEQCASTLIFR